MCFIAVHPTHWEFTIRALSWKSEHLLCQPGGMTHFPLGEGSAAYLQPRFFCFGWAGFKSCELGLTKPIPYSYNSLRKLSPTDFAGLERLELLMLHSNEISSIPEKVFSDLRSLQVRAK